MLPKRKLSSVNVSVISTLLLSMGMSSRGIGSIALRISSVKISESNEAVIMAAPRSLPNSCSVDPSSEKSAQQRKNNRFYKKPQEILFKKHSHTLARSLLRTSI